MNAATWMEQATKHYENAGHFAAMAQRCMKEGNTCMAALASKHNAEQLDLADACELYAIAAREAQ